MTLRHALFLAFLAFSVRRVMMRHLLLFYGRIGRQANARSFLTIVAACRKPILRNNSHTRAQHRISIKAWREEERKKASGFFSPLPPMHTHNPSLLFLSGAC